MKYGFGYRIGNFSPQAGYAAETQAVIDYANGQGYALPSANTLTQLDTLIGALKTSGIWAKIDVLYILATDGDRNFAKINIKTPGTHNCTEIGTPTFTSKQGFTGSTGNALNTNYNSLTDGAASRLNQSLFTWVYSTPALNTANQNSIGSSSAVTSFGGTYIVARANQFTGSGDRIRSRFNSTAEVTFSSATTAGLFHMDRNNGTDHQFYLNGTLDATAGQTGNSDNDVDMYVCASNSSGSVSAPLLVPVSIAGSGQSLASEKSDLYSAFNNYMNSI